MDTPERVITPRNEEDTIRYRFLLSPEDAELFDTNLWCDVTDLNTSRRWRIYRDAECGLGCKCDAVAEEIIQRSK